MKSVIPKFLLFVMMTTDTAVAADSSSMMTTATAVAADSSSSSSTLATTLASEEDEERASTTTPPPEGFEASSLSSSSSVVEVSSATHQLTSYNSTDGGGAGSAPRKLSKTSKKVKHPKALCTLRLFADSQFRYANQCFTDIRVTISPCEDTDTTCYISERLPLLPQEQEQNPEEVCFVGGAFPAKQNIRYNPSTGDCEFLYVDLTDDPCNMYTGDTGTGSLGLKARINVKNNPDVMFIQFTNDKGVTFYNTGDDRVAVRTTTHNNRYLHQDGKTTPVLSMMPRPRDRHRRMAGCNSIDGDFDWNDSLLT